jgi:hypothetical protein
VSLLAVSVILRCVTLWIGETNPQTGAGKLAPIASPVAVASRVAAVYHELGRDAITLSFSTLCSMAPVRPYDPLDPTPPIINGYSIIGKIRHKLDK